MTIELLQALYVSQKGNVNTLLHLGACSPRNQRKHADKTAAVKSVFLLVNITIFFNVLNTIII
jgi:hypothetical protein